LINRKLRTATGEFSRKLFRIMKNERSVTPIQLLAIIIAVLFSLQAASAQVQWRRISQAEMEMKTPKVEADADAEAIFWEIRLDDEKRKKMFYNHYVRVKIFTERGRERFSKFDIPFTKGKTVEEVAARVIKPDGTIIELQPGDIFERDIVKAGKFFVRAKSFAVPGIEPGVIVEYQYKETIKNDSADNERLLFQRDIPIQRMTYYVRPYKDTRLNFAFQNMPEMRFVPDTDGFYVGTRENVPAFREEPQMPPDDEVRQWVLLSYKSYYGFRWNLFGTPLGIGFDEITKPSKEIEQKAREITEGAPDDDVRLKNIYDFAQKQIRNISFDTTITDEQRADIKNKKAADTLKRGMGDSGDINLLFASLAKAAGFDVTGMFSGDRSDNFFDYQKDLNPRYLHQSGIAVRRGGKWLPFNPGVPFMPFGMVNWQNEVVSTMIAGDGGYDWTNLPLADYTKNVSKRTGKFKLLEDGTLEGFIRVEHNGHQATTRRYDLFTKTPAEREEILKKAWKETVSTAEISDLSIENFNDSSKPYTYSFKVRVPNYAQKTGKRLFFQPGFFEYGTNPLFSGDTRKYSIYFEFPWSENDEIEIELPKNFEADSVDSPGAVVEKSGLGGLNIKIELAKDSNILKFNRQFFFGAKGSILFPATAYKPLKILFDTFHKADTYTVSLKQKQ
jgi:hypothetical protein